jgi:hypothetical protein
VGLTLFPSSKACKGRHGLVVTLDGIPESNAVDVEIGLDRYHGVGNRVLTAKRVSKVSRPGDLVHDYFTTTTGHWASCMIRSSPRGDL